MHAPSVRYTIICDACTVVSVGMVCVIAVCECGSMMAALPAAAMLGWVSWGVLEMVAGGDGER